MIHHSAAGVDPLTPISKKISAITAKKASTRTESDAVRLRELETIQSLWLDDDEKVVVPTTALRSCIETAARKLKQGPQVREGMLVIDSEFTYDKERYGESLDELQSSTQFTVPVVVNRNRILRTRAKFNTEWSVDFTIDGDDELVSRDHLLDWLDIAGRRIGLGDWRPEKSGVYGRFTATSIEPFTSLNSVL